MQSQGQSRGVAPHGVAANFFPPVSSDDPGYCGLGFPHPLPPPPPLPHPAMHGRGVSRPPALLGVQGGGILKRLGGPAQAPHLHGRGHARGYGGRAWAGGRGRKNLTKEALDADLDEWRLRDRRLAGQSLDAELDNYWRKKETTEETKADVFKSFEDAEDLQKREMRKELDLDPEESVTVKDPEPMKDVNIECRT